MAVATRQALAGPQRMLTQKRLVAGGVRGLTRSDILEGRFPRFADQASGRDGQILIAAYHCISELGIAATTMRAVAQRAGVNQGLIHYYFASKDELLLEVLRGLLENAVSIMRTVRDSDLSPTDKITCVLRSGANFVQRSEEVLVRISLWAHAMSQKGVWWDTYRKLSDDMQATLIDIVEQGVVAGEFQVADTRAVAMTIIAAYQGIGMQYTVEPLDFAGKDVGGRLTDIFLKILGVTLR